MRSEVVHAKACGWLDYRGCRLHSHVHAWTPWRHVHVKRVQTRPRLKEIIVAISRGGGADEVVHAKACGWLDRDCRLPTRLARE